MKKHTPFRDATSSAANAAVLVFVGSLVLGLINKSLDGLISIEVEREEKKDTDVDTAMVD